MEVDGESAIGGNGGGVDVAAPVSEAERFALLKGAVKDSPTDYSAHLSFVEYLRRERPGSLELSKARQGFSERFPLSPDLWQEWIDDRRAAGGEDALGDVLGLYERAFADYQCAKLWPGYLETLEESLDEDDEGGVSTMREAFERALTIVGVHPILGGAVWRALLRFEKEELEDAQETGADAVEISRARDRVKRVYRRQLAVPLVGNDEILQEAKEAFSDDAAGFKEACLAHTMAKKMLSARIEHEQAIARCQEENPGGMGAANAWEAYAAMETADGHPSRAALVLERAESEGCCLHERIWITHSDLLLAQMGAKDQEEALTARAVRNVPWSAELWCRRLRSLERSAKRFSVGSVLMGGSSGDSDSAEGIRRVWKAALSSALPSPDEYIKVLLAYCASFRRRLLREVEAAVKGKQPSETVIGPASPGQRQQGGPAAAGEKEPKDSGTGVALALEGMRGAFDEAEAFVDKNYPGWDEGWLSVVRQRIQIEDEMVEDIADLDLEGVGAGSQARRQWDRVLRHSGKRLASWVEAVKWERGSTGDLDACRRLYARGMKEVQDFPEAVYTAYLNFEQEVGSLEDWDAANREVFKSRAARGLLSSDLPLASRVWAGGAAAQPLHQPTQRQQQAKAKKQQKQQQQRQPGDRGESKRTGSNKRAVPGPPPGRVENSDASHPGATSAKRARTTATDGERPLVPGELSGKKQEDGKGSRGEAVGGGATDCGGGSGPEGLTAFVVNLPFTTTDVGLAEMFKACGEVTGARVLSNPKGRSKGLGYVTFASKDALAKALSLDGTDIDGRTISVERSLPRGARPAKGAARPTKNGTGGGEGKSGADATTAATPAAAAQESAGVEAGREAGGGGGSGAGSIGGGASAVEVGATEGADKKKKKKRKIMAEREVVVFGGGGGSGSGSGGIKWPAHPTTIFVRGLGMSATSKDLREAFVGAGTVVEARVVQDKKTGETKGYGLVQFEEVEAVERALALDGTSMCGGTAKITRSRHPAVVAVPSTAPGASAESQHRSDGVGSDAATASKSSRRANDWDCPNVACDNVCFSFRTSCNRCGMGKDGTPPPKDIQQGGGRGGKGAESAGEPVAPTSHRPRLQLRAAIKPRALRNARPTNGAEHTPSVPTVPAVVAATDAAAAPNKSNADFRAMLFKK